MSKFILFQSTPSVWKATVQQLEHKGIFRISIHAFRVEGDHSGPMINGYSPHFNPRLPCGRRQNPCCSRGGKFYISIHAFRVEGDLGQNGTMDDMHEFQSTPSVWKATFRFDYNITVKTISIHAFRVEGDDVERVQSVDNADFNPRLPCGRRLQKLTGDLLNTHIICIYVHKAVALFYNQWHRKPLSTLLFYNFFGANGTVILCLHPIRTKTATLLQHQNRYSHRSVRLWFYSYCRDNRT